MSWVRISSDINSSKISNSWIIYGEIICYFVSSPVGFLVQTERLTDRQTEVSSIWETSEDAVSFSLALKCNYRAVKWLPCMLFLALPHFRTDLTDCSISTIIWIIFCIKMYITESQKLFWCRNLECNCEPHLDLRWGQHVQMGKKMSHLKEMQYSHVIVHYC